jgi:hypothetical protein
MPTCASDTHANIRGTSLDVIRDDVIGRLNANTPAAWIARL